MSGEGGYRASGTNYSPVLFQWPGGIGNNSQHHMLRQVTFNDSQERTVNGSKDCGKFKTTMDAEVVKDVKTERDVKIEKDAMLTKQKPLAMLLPLPAPHQHPRHNLRQVTNQDSKWR